MILNLLSLRQSQKISRKELGDIIGVQDYTIADWENGRTEPSIDKLIKIADYFNISIDFLVGRQFENDNITPIYAAINNYIQTFQIDPIKKDIIILIDKLNDEQKKKALKLLKFSVKEIL